MSDEGIQTARVTKVSDESPLIGARHFVRASFEGQGSRSGTNGTAEYPVGLGGSQPVERARSRLAVGALLLADRAWFAAHSGRRFRLIEPTPGALRSVECYTRGRTRMDLYASPVSGNFNLFAVLTALSRVDLRPEDAPEDWLAALAAYLQRYWQAGGPWADFPQIERRPSEAGK